MHLVTGGSGFIGAALVRALLLDGVSVRVLDDNSRGKPRRLQGVDDKIEFVQGDVRDLETMKAASEGCETVWHLAYINGTRHFYERPDAVLDVGVRGTLNAIDAALHQGVKRFVFASTSETYNTPTHIPTTETERLMIPDITNPRFSYGGGKITGELLTLHYGGVRGLESVIVRPHNVYGPDMGFAHVIPEIVEKILVASRRLTQTEVDLPIQGDGQETRAFCYVDDGAEGFRLAGQNGDSGEIYHLGVSEEITIADLIHAMGDVLNVKLNLVAGDLRAGGTKRRCPSIEKLSAIGYSPKVSLEEGIRRTVEWYADHFLTAGVEMQDVTR